MNDIISLFKKSYKDFLHRPESFFKIGAQYLLRQAFIRSKGDILDWAYKLQLEKTPFKNSDPSSKFFDGFTESTIQDAVEHLKTYGYYVLPYKINNDWINTCVDKCKNLEVFCKNNPSDIQKPVSLTPKDSATYWHKNDIFNISEFIELVKDKFILEIIGRYLGCIPVFDLMTAWWSFPTNSNDPEYTQLYHFDLDRIRWLKVFVYLNDVNINNGPHAFISGSHKTIGQKIRRDSRLPDEEVYKLYSVEDEKIFTGRAGTVIIEDTLGLHKGLCLNKNHRFIFEYQYSINSFGYNYNLKLD